VPPRTQTKRPYENISRKKGDKITDYETAWEMPKRRTEIQMWTRREGISSEEGRKNMAGN